MIWQSNNVVMEQNNGLKKKKNNSKRISGDGNGNGCKICKGNGNGYKDFQK